MEPEACVFCYVFVFVVFFTNIKCWNAKIWHSVTIKRCFSPEPICPCLPAQEKFRVLMRFGLSSVSHFDSPYKPIADACYCLKPEGLSVAVGDINFAAYQVTVFPASCTLYSLFASAGFTFVFIVEKRTENGCCKIFGSCFSLNIDPCEFWCHLCHRMSYWLYILKLPIDRHWYTSPDNGQTC